MALYIQLSTQNVLTKFLSVSSITGGNSVNGEQLASTVASLLTNSVIPPYISTQGIFTDTLVASTITTSSITSGVVSTLVLYASSIIGVTTGGGLVTLPSTISTFAILTSSLQASTVTASVLSTQQLFASSIVGNTISSLSMNAGTFVGTNLFVSSATLSTFSTNNINFAGGFGYLTMPDIYPNTVYTSTVTASNLLVGWNSVVSPIQFFGYGNYTNSVVAEVSTGGTTQELVMFRGSNATDRIRMQTTGSIVFEPGVSARLWPTVPSNVTPAMVITTSSNVGIQTATPQTTLDVAGTGRFQQLSTLNINVSTINGQAYSAGGGVTSNLIIPFSTFPPVSTFDMNTTVPSSLIAFGTNQTGLQSQFYIGDLYNQANFSTLSSPTLLLEQTLPAQNITLSTYRSSATFTVPANVNLLNVHLWGSGGQQYPGNLGAGGGGAYLTGYIRVVPSQTLSIQVNLGVGIGSQARGGGCTAIFTQGSSFANVIAVAAGGGGGGSFATTIGGGGGIVTGKSGTYRNPTTGGGAPGTQTAPGNIGSAWQLQGGIGTNGGGSGLFGGGSGENNSVDNTGGGGGSSLFSNLISWSGEDGQNGGLAGGQGSRYYSSGFGNCNSTGFNGAAVLAWSAGIRPGNLFETRGPTQTIGFGISQTTSVGLNVSSINSAITLEVNGIGSFSTLQANTAIPTTLTVPFTSNNPGTTVSTQSIFAMNTISSGTQVAFGTTQAYGTVGKYSQIYAGDLRSLRGELNNTAPLMLLEQDFPLVASSNVIISVFSTTVNSFVVPSSVSMAKAYLWGQGGFSPFINVLAGPGTNSASGAFVSGAFTVTPGEIISVAVNYQGGTPVGSDRGGAGGGLTGVFRSSINWSTSIAIAAGGGGGGSYATSGGGFPGFPAGGSSTYRSGVWITTMGGTQTGGGTTPILATYGSALRGGAANGSGGGGGGAGYFGGAGGFDNTVDYLGGGGGSSYIGGLISTSVVLENGATGIPIGAVGGGKFAPFYRSTIADSGNTGFAVLVFPRVFRQANLLEVRAASRSTITGIDYTLAMGVQVPVINSTIALDVGGTGRFQNLSTLNLNLSTINGQAYSAGGGSTSLPSTISTFSLLTSSIQTSTLRIGTWLQDEAANIGINDPTEATTSSGMMVMKMGQGVSNVPMQYVSSIFSTTGSTFVIPIPVNVNNVYLSIWGAGGGGTQNLYARGDGGGGAYLGGYLQVNPNSNLYVIVGKGGQSTLSRGTFAEGFGGGTNGGSQSASGGGFSAVFANMSTPTGVTSSFLVIAGAGGGAGYGGDNAGWAAASGTSWTGARFNGTQYRTSFVPGGGYLTGGGGGGQFRAGDGVNINSIVYIANSGGKFFGGTSVTGGGGGGGGYYGGGAGGNNQGDFYDNTGGGAGSSYGDLLKDPVLCNANGKTAGGSTIQGWSFGAGLGGGGVATLPYMSGSNGLVIITYLQPAIGKNKRFVDYRDVNNSTLSYVDSNGALAIQVSSLVGGYAASIGAPSFMSTMVTDFVQTTQVNASGNLNVGGNAIFQGPTQISSLTVTTTTLTSTMLIGVSPFQSYMAFFGNTGDYNRTVIAEQSNGMVGGLNIQQEMLLFRGPSATDRIRMQTTGPIVFEPGVSSRIFPNTPSNATPAMIININSNVGIQTANPIFPLDVTGIARATSLSTLNIQLSTINGQAFGAPIQSTVQGLGSAGYISTSQLVSTVAGLGSGGSAFTGSTNSLSSGQIFTSSIVGNQLQFITLSSQALYVSSFFTATRQATPMFITF